MASSTITETIDTAACANCGARESDDTKLKICNACKMARYCCRGCQVSHWPRHRVACKKRAAELFEKELFKDPPEMKECPICMLPFSHDKNSSVFFACCGNLICNGCLHAQFKEDATNGKEWEDCQACAFCRTPATQDAKERIRRVNRNVERNHAPSMYQLAAYFVRGEEGLEKDIMKAIELFEKSGRLGYAESYHWLGLVYCYGRDGVKRDMKKGRHYLELGAIGGCIRARHELGGLDLKEGNRKRAKKHFLISAKAGLTESLETLKTGRKDESVAKDEYAEALRAYLKQHQDTRSKTRDEAPACSNTELNWRMYYYLLRAKKSPGSLYSSACLDWNEGNFSRACEAQKLGLSQL